MKSPFLTLSMLLVLGLSAQAQVITTYLVNFGPVNGPQFSGSPSIFEDATLTPLPAGTIIVNPDPTDENYSLGSDTLTLTSNTYSFGASGTTQTALTHSFAYQTGGGLSTISLTGIAASSTVNFQFIGTSQPFIDEVAVQGGATAPSVGTQVIAQAPDGSTPVFTNYGTLTGFTQYSGVFTQTTGGEGDIGGALITITTAAAPEPSTYVLMGAGLLALFAINRRRALQATL